MGTSVLCVDDSATVRRILRRALSETGFDVIDAVDGMDAWSQIESGVRPSLMFCDVNMPRMNGLELLEKLHGAGHVAWLPVLMLTTEGKPELIQLATSMGAKGWILKPFKNDHLVAEAQRFVKPWVQASEAD